MSELVLVLVVLLCVAIAFAVLRAILSIPPLSSSPVPQIVYALFGILAIVLILNFFGFDSWGGHHALFRR